jgi:hypothetical protein
MELTSSGMNEKVAMAQPEEQAENNLNKNNTTSKCNKNTLAIVCYSTQNLLNNLIIKLIILLQGIVLFFQ